MTESELIEQLSASEHESWARWMQYLFSKCEHNPDGSMTIPEESVRWWQDLAELPYSHLSEHSKQSDRDEVAHILPIIEEYTGGPAVVEQLEETEDEFLTRLSDDYPVI